MKKEQEQQKERAGLLRDLLDNLALIMTDAQVMEASNAATNFRNLLAIDRWLNRDLATLVARREAAAPATGLVPSQPVEEPALVAGQVSVESAIEADIDDSANGSGA